MRRVKLLLLPLHSQSAPLLLSFRCTYYLTFSLHHSTMPRRRAIYLLSLITYLQATDTLAVPLAASYQGTSTTLGTDAALDRRRPPRIVLHDVAGIDHATTTTTTWVAAKNPGPAMPVYQIGDGQVQAQYARTSSKHHVRRHIAENLLLSRSHLS